MYVEWGIQIFDFTPVLPVAYCRAHGKEKCLWPVALAAGGHQLQLAASRCPALSQAAIQLHPPPIGLFGRWDSRSDFPTHKADGRGAGGLSYTKYRWGHPGDQAIKSTPHINSPVNQQIKKQENCIWCFFSLNFLCIFQSL